MESIGDYRLDPPADPPDPSDEETEPKWLEMDVSTLLDFLEPATRRGRFNVESWNLLAVELGDGVVRFEVAPDAMRYDP